MYLGTKRLKQMIQKIIGIFIFLISGSTMIAQNAWEMLNPIPVPGPGVHHPCTFEIDTFGYSMTGSMFIDDTSRYTKFAYKYLRHNDEWVALPDFPGKARSYAVGLAHQGKGYLGFGVGADTSYNDLWEFDPLTETWQELPSCPCEPRLHPAFAATNGKIYVGTGNNETNLNDFWEYDIATQQWTERDTLPGPKRHHPFYFAIDTFVYVGFGHGSVSVNGDVIYKDFHKFNVNTNQWTTLDTFPGEQRVAGTQFAAFGKGYILSGDGAMHVPMAKGEFWEFDPLTELWKELPPHLGPQALWAPGSFVLGDYAYMIAGLGVDGLLKEVQRYRIHDSTVPSIDHHENVIQIIQMSNSVLRVVGANSTFENYTVRIHDVSGRLIMTRELQNANEIQLPSDFTGAFICTVSDGVDQWSGRFVKY